MEIPPEATGKVPALPLAAATLLGATAVGIVGCLMMLPAVGNDALGLAREFLFRSLLAGLFAGVPVALLALRDPRASVRRWLGAGVLAGAIAVIGTGLVSVGPGNYLFLLLFTFAGPMMLVVVAIGIVLGALSALVARALLAVFTGWSASRPS